METNNVGLVNSCLAEWGFRPCTHIEEINLEGVCYKPADEYAKGFYWFYENANMFAISVMDIQLKRDAVLEFQQPEFISVNYYDTISGEELNPYKRLNANCIRGHISKGELFRARFHANVPIHGMELMLMPGYYRDYLNQKYPGDFPDAKAAFHSIDGITDFSELVLIMRQIQTFRGTGASAHLYYESKVAEAISLIAERTKSSKRFVPSGDLSPADMKNLDAVKSYIADHFAFSIQADQLAKIACMGQTKLRYAFKKIYGYTITDFIHNKRMAHAEYMLIKTDFPINQIAEAVGCHHAGRFSNLFQKTTGLLPEEYRKIMRK